jgi:hypothetical protein
MSPNVPLAESREQMLRHRYEMVRARLAECHLRSFDELSDEEQNIYSLILLNDEVLPLQP